MHSLTDSLTHSLTDGYTIPDLSPALTQHTGLLLFVGENVSPTTLPEVIFAFTALIVGAVLFSIILGNMVFSLTPSAIQLPPLLPPSSISLFPPL